MNRRFFVAISSATPALPSFRGTAYIVLAAGRGVRNTAKPTFVRLP
jgi:hypothetical protein